MANEVKAVPISRRSAILHTALGLAALAALALTRLPRLQPYASLITLLCGALGVGSVAAAKAYLPPRVRAIVETFSPTPALPEEKSNA